MDSALAKSESVNSIRFIEEIMDSLKMVHLNTVDAVAGRKYRSIGKNKTFLVVDKNILLFMQYFGDIAILSPSESVVMVVEFLVAIMSSDKNYHYYYVQFACTQMIRILINCKVIHQ